jgi:hypothetical protein
VSNVGRPEAPPGWNRSLPERLPQPTAAPALFAFGVMLFGWGLISTPLVVLVGGALLLIALIEWIREIWHDAK